MEEKKGVGKLGAAFFAAFIGSYVMTQLSLRGVNFEVLGVSSELVKSTIVAHLVTFFVWLTPRNMVEWITEVIIFWKSAFKKWRNAANNE